MGTVTVWQVTHACGHTAKRDLSNKRIDQRAAYADWLTQWPCVDCYSRNNTIEQNRAKERETMGIPTMWKIEHKCGHKDERDLSNKRIDQRAGYARWLEGKDCFECYKAKNDGTVRRKQAKEREQEINDAESTEKRSGLEPLAGSEKQQRWARVIRSEIITNLYDEYVTTGKRDEDWFEHSVLEPARMIATSRWWIDNREYSLSHYPDLIAAGARSTDGNENIA